MACRIRDHDWSATPLGPVERWPPSLRNAVTLVLDHPLPMVLGWGPDLVTIYNDAYRPLLGAKHEALGRPFLQVWEEARSIVAPQIAEALEGQTLRFENARFLLARGGELKEAWFDYSYSPLRDDAGMVAGMLKTAFERTVHVLAERQRAGAEDALREREERQAFLLRLNDAMRPLADPTEVQTVALRLLAEHLGLSRAAYSEIDEDQDRARRVVTFDRDLPPVPTDVRMSQFSGEQLACYLAGDTFVVADTETDPRVAATREGCRAIQVRAWVGVPLVKDGRLLVVFGVEKAVPHGWTESEVRLIEEAAERTWAASQRARAEAALRASQEMLAADLASAELLRGLAERTVGAESIATVHDEILSATVAIARADAGTIQVYDPDTKALEIIASRNFSRKITDYFHQVDASSRTACGIALETGQRTLVDFQDEDEDPGCGLLVGEGIMTAIAVPLVSRSGAPLGMLNAHWRQARHRPSDRELRFVELLARQAADLIEGRRITEALRLSEARFRGALEIETVGATFWNPRDYTLKQANDAFLRMIGRSREEAIGITSHELTAPEFREESRARVADAERTGILPPYEKQILRPDGSRVWLLCSGRMLKDDLFEFILDVDERHRSEAAMRDSELRLRQFGDASQDVLWIRDAETLQWEYLTPAFEDIYGLAREEALTGNNYRSWLDLIVPEDRQLATHAIQRVRAGEHVAFEYRVRRPVDGAIRWLRNTDFPISDDGGEIKLIGGIGHDLTELREAELRLKALVEGIPQLVWRAGRPGEWTWASPQWTQFTGQTEAESHGWGWLEPLHPDDRQIARAAWAHAVEHGRFEAEYRICATREGGYRWFQTRAEPVRGEGGEIIEWLGTSTDIHELRSLQERQRVLVAELQHRTFNLMGMIRSTADATIRSSRNLDEFKGMFRERIAALARVQRLLSRLKDDDRITFDELIRSELDAAGVLQDGYEGVTLEGPTGVTLRSSSVQTFAMALHELTTNAVKYGALKQAGARLDVRWRVELRNEREPWLHLAWQETGVAMPEAGSAPTGTGQGRRLIEEALPYQFQAETTYVMAPDGVRCAITLPASARMLSEMRDVD